MNTVNQSERKPHKHAELIKKWADGATIQSRNPNYGSADVGPEWTTSHLPFWYDFVEYRVKPAPVYPKSSLTLTDLIEQYFNRKIGADDLSIYSSTDAYWRRIADAAVKQYMIDNGIEPK